MRPADDACCLSRAPSSFISRKRMVDFQRAPGIGDTKPFLGSVGARSGLGPTLGGSCSRSDADRAQLVRSSASHLASIVWLDSTSKELGARFHVPASQTRCSDICSR